MPAATFHRRADVSHTVVPMTPAERLAHATACVTLAAAWHVAARKAIARARLVTGAQRCQWVQTARFRNATATAFRRRAAETTRTATTVGAPYTVEG